MTRAHLSARAAAVLLTAAAGTASFTSAAVAGTPADTGCPSSYEQLSVTWLESQGPYQLPRQLDESGNNDGFVCGKQLSDHASSNFCGGPCDVPIYDFTDNHRTPSYH